MSRLIISLFKPRLIGKFLKDHILLVLLYFVSFVLLCSIPSMASLYNTPSLTYDSEIVLFNNIASSSFCDYKIIDNKLTGTGEIIFRGENISISFNTQDKESTFNITFNTDYLNIYYDGEKAGTIYYTKINTNLDMSNVQERDFEQIRILLIYINQSYDIIVKDRVPYLMAMTFIDNLLSFGFIAILLVCLSASFNRDIPLRIRINVCIYSMTWLFILSFIGNNFNTGLLFYIGVIIAFIFSALALKSLIKIKKE